MKKTNKHAFLIMAHHDFDCLTMLLHQIDNAFFDIYLHIDKKSKLNKKLLLNICRFSNVHIIKSITVKWGTYSQIKCEMKLIKTAMSSGNYTYFHLLSGNDALLVNSNQVYSFFENNSIYKYNYIHFCDSNFNKKNIDRLKFYHFFNRNNYCSAKLNNVSLKIQKKLRVDRVKNRSIYFGSNWFSITNDFATYVIKCEKKYKKMFHYTFCADEAFLQTIIMESKFRNTIYKGGNMREIDWVRGSPYVFDIYDVDELKKSTMLFVRKIRSSQMYELLNDNKN